MIFMRRQISKADGPNHRVPYNEFQIRGVKYGDPARSRRHAGFLPRCVSNHLVWGFVTSNDSTCLFFKNLDGADKGNGAFLAHSYF